MLTEQSSGWIPGTLSMLDFQYSRFTDAANAESHFGAELVKAIPEPPSYYWKNNCFVGASFLRPNEAPLRYDIGIDKIMWGQDYPHIEGTYPYTTEALRHTFAGIDPDEVGPMLGGNAGPRLRLRPRGACPSGRSCRTTGRRSERAARTRTR